MSLGVADDTVVVFSGDNGPQELEPWRGHPGFLDGSYFTGMEGSLRTPCLIRWPGQVPSGRQSNEVVHITDMFTTLLSWAGLRSPLWPGGRRYSSAQQICARGISILDGRRAVRSEMEKLQNGDVHVANVAGTLTQACQPAYHQSARRPERAERHRSALHPLLDSRSFGRILKDFAASVRREPLITAGSPLAFVP
ncbi:sulfatase-like hydrolase/transferase [Rhizobium cauense]|uniref:sulfatase-like hydrolase/transferase n=1 Tax=Rhizobium cauense TaxID=1166683 RepID=UPI001CB79F51|nr:sulfatase-like hydrolase/transferase [Rhizobium cauense]